MVCFIVANERSIYFNFKNSVFSHIAAGVIYNFKVHVDGKILNPICR